MSRSGCALSHKMARGTALRIPTSQAHTPIAGQSQGGEEVTHISGSRRAKRLVVPNDDGHESVPTLESARPPRCVASGSGSGHSVLQASDQEAASTGMASERDRLLKQGFSVEGVYIILTDKAPSTITEYESR